MKLVRYGPYGGEKPGLIDDEKNIRDLSHLIGDFSGMSLSADTLDMLSKLEVDMLPRIEDNVRLGACVGDVRNFIGVHGNYIAGEKTDPENTDGSKPRPALILFNKAPSCVVGAQDPIMLPKGEDQPDWEVELAIVIGRRGSHIRQDQALDYIAGYCICNDITGRKELEEGSGQFIKAKSAPTFGPLGPWLVTVDEIPNPHNLEMWVELNGKRLQKGSTSSMLYTIPEIISYVSRYMALEPGDVITTGSPQGSGHEMEPQVYLKKGDRVKLSIDGLGAQEQKILAWID
ncbi:MAG: fumarylacetoacetate hydrolase family protein [Pseudomonadota bacterium]